MKTKEPDLNQELKLIREKADTCALPQKLLLRGAALLAECAAKVFFRDRAAHYKNTRVV